MAESSERARTTDEVTRAAVAGDPALAPGGGAAARRSIPSLEDP